MLDQKRTAGLLAGEHQHGLGQPGLRHMREVVGILLEVLEVLEARAHAAGLGVGLGIDLLVRFLHRLRLVGREVVPEVFKIDTFATLDQGKRSVVIEVKMP